MEASHNARLHQFQQAHLRERARETGDWSRVVFFAWRLGDTDLLAELGAIGDVHANTRAALALAQSDGETLCSIQHHLRVNRSWLLYFLARYWLRLGDVRKAIDCGKRSLELVPGHNPAFQLAVTAMFQQGNLPLAKSLAARLLEIAPEQDDLRVLLESPEALPRDGQTDVLDTPLPRIGFYIPVYNAAACLPTVLDGILGQAYPLSEFAVIDDGSTDDSADLAGAYPVQLIRHGRNRGLAAARNTALKTMSSDYIGSCDSDAVLDPEYLIYAAIELQSALLRPTLVGGRMIEQHTGTLADSWRDTHMTQDTGPVRKSSTSRCSGPVYAPGCNTLLDRALVLSLGGYDESHVAVGEDGYLNRLLHDKGHRLSTTPLARCRHLRRDTPLSVLRTRWNYEREGHERILSFKTLGNFLGVFAIHLDTAARMADEDAKERTEHLLPMEVLYVYVMFFRSLRQARLEGALTLGQEHWFQRAVCAGSLLLKSDSFARLRRLRDRELHPLMLPPDTPIHCPPPHYVQPFRDTLDAFNEWTHGLPLTRQQLST